MAYELTIPKSFWHRTRDYFAEVRAEMRRVTWPGKQEVYGTTVMVILTTFFFAAVFAVYDWIFSHAVSRVLAWFAHQI